MDKRLLFLGLTLLLIIAVIGFQSSNLPESALGQPQIVDIPSGASTAEIGARLEAAGVISNAWIFRGYAKLAGVDGTLKAGHYQFAPGLSLGEITRKLVEGSPELISVTITEGQTVNEIAQTLSRAGIVNSAEFQRLAYDPGYVLGEDLPDWLSGAESLEGFLFPDTYYFASNQTSKGVLRVMFNQFLSETKELRESSYVEELGVYQWVTLASLVEKEAKVTEEFPVIASVFRNRLERKMYLQSCATVQYALGTRKPVLTEEDLKVESPYNTYKYNGLPPGPIASPGLKALRAAANPANTDFLYFVADGDGSHIFTKTYREHLRAKNRVERGQ